MKKADSSTNQRRIVLVGTYRGDQLKEWRGWYNYPISAKDKIRFPRMRCEKFPNFGFFVA